MPCPWNSCPCQFSLLVHDWVRQRVCYGRFQVSQFVTCRTKFSAGLPLRPLRRTIVRICFHRYQLFLTNLQSQSLRLNVFIAPRDTNRRTWFYRIRPAVLHRPFQRVSTQLSADFSAHPPNPNQVSPFTLSQVNLLFFNLIFQFFR